MTDIHVQFVSDLIASATATATVNAPTDFDSVTNLSRAFLVPAAFPTTTAGIGRETGSLNNSLASITATATITDTDTVTFDDGDASIARNNRCGAWLMEYVGPSGGPNEIINRGQFTITLAAGALTADSDVITGVTTLADCVPFAFASCTLNSASYTAHFPDVQIVASGAGHVVRVTRLNSNGTMTVRGSLVEHTGSNWTVQEITHTFVASATNEDETISSIGSAANAYTYSVMASTNVNVPAQQTYYVYPTSATNLRHRIITKPTTAPTVRTWVISNPLLNVTRYGVPDGTNAITASGVSPETVNVTIDALPNLEQAMLLAYVGSNSSVNTSCPSPMWLSDLTTTTNWRLRRSTSVGDTDYVGQAIDFSGLISADIADTTDFVPGSTFTINGVFPDNPTVTLGGVEQTVDTSSASVITGTCVLGTLIYGTQELRVEGASGGLATAQALLTPASGRNYVTLASPMLVAASRATSTDTDLASGDQLEWSNVQGGTVADVTIGSNGLMRVTTAVTAFDLRANDGTGWGDIGVQAWEDIPTPTSAPPEFTGTIPDLVLQYNTALTPQDYSGEFSDDGDLTFGATGLPAGLSLSSAGVLSGTPTTIGTYTSITIGATDDDDQSAISNPFTITVQSDQDYEPEFIGPNLGAVAMPRGQAYNLDLDELFDHLTDPLTYSITGTLPDGLELVGQYITGTPTTAGIAIGLLVTATDLDGDTAQTDLFTMEVYVPSDITIEPLPGGITIEIL